MSDKVKVILDTDTYNEVDDQFALVYAMLSQDVIDLQAVHAAPFFNAMSKGPEDGMERSYDEIVRLIGLMGSKPDGFIFKGSRRYIGDIDKPCENDAVFNLIEKADKCSVDNPLNVVSIGAPTNVSSAILLKPEIIDKIKVVWLGGNGRSWPYAREFNLMQDLTASQVLFDSKVDLVQIPCWPVASHLAVSVPELKENMGSSQIAKSLIKLVEEPLDGIKGHTRVIWDISAVAYVVKKHLVATNKIHSPILNDNFTYSFDERRHFIECAYKVNRDKIFDDFYKKIQKIK